MSLPSRSEFSPVRSASQVSQPGLCFHRDPHGPAESCSPHTSRCPGDCVPSWSFWALRRSFRCSDSANSTYVSLTDARLSCPDSATSSGFPSPSTFHSASASPTLFHIGVAPGLPFSFEGFSPSVAPGASRLAVSSLSLSPSAPLRSPLSIGFEDVSIGRMRCRRYAGLVRRGARSFLSCFPLRGIDLLGLAPRFRGAPLLGFSGSSFRRDCSRWATLTSCSSEFQRTKKSTRLALRLPPWGFCRLSGLHLAAESS
jgi:uncharacterized protein YjeT (DUF2065 family)